MGGHTIRFILFILTSAFFLLSISSNDVFSQATENPVSPSRNIHHKPERGKERKSKNLPDGYRTIDGSGNNLSSLEMGSSFSRLLRLVSSDYSDSISELSGKNRSSARKISNIVASQDELIPNEHQATDYLWQWGQFLDHDIDLTDGTQPPEKENILVPAGDKYFDPESTGTEIIEFNRSLYDKNTGTGIDNPREQLNEITAWIDASNIYGSNTERANALRANDGSGRMKMQDNLLTFNTLGLPNAGGEGENLFISGDVRANEQVALTAMHTLFSREHNRLADIIAEENPDYTGDEIYEKARKIVGAEMQVITYNEFLPSLLGDGRLSDYNGYNPNINSDIMNEFSTAAYRFGHSALSPTLLRLNKEMEVIQQGNLPLRNAFFSPARIVEEGGIDPLLRGLSAQECQKIDPFIIDDVRNFLFGQPGSGGFDLASLNIQRGRDHGLPGYNKVRSELGLGPVNSFSEISSDPVIHTRLAGAYHSVDDVDLWVGGLSEDPLPGSHLGELFTTLIVMQFEALRDGDRFWYELTFSGEELEDLKNTRLSDIIRRNTDIGDEIQDNVFSIPDVQSSGGCTIAGTTSVRNGLIKLIFLFGIAGLILFRRILT